MENEAIHKERSFSVELKSKAQLKSFTLMNGPAEGVLIEGTIGKLKRATFAEGIILEVIGNSGILRIDLGEDDVEKKQSKDEKRGESAQ